MELCTGEILQLVDRFLCCFIRCCADGKGDQYFVCVQTRVFAVQMSCFQILDRLNDRRRDELYFICYTGECF